MNKKDNFILKLVIISITLTVLCFTILIFSVVSYYIFINNKTTEQNSRYNYEQFINYDINFANFDVKKTK